MKVHLVGGGLASLAAAAHLIRDGGVPGHAIHIYESRDAVGGAIGMGGTAETGYSVPASRMFEPEYRCLFELLSFIPSAGDPGRSIMEDTRAFFEECRWNDRARLIGGDGRILDFHRFGLHERDRFDLATLALTPEHVLDGKRVDECFAPHFFTTHFWYMWASIFAFVPSHGATEMHRYARRFVHLMPSMASMSAIIRTRFNQADSVLTPLTGWLRGHGVNMLTGTRVTDIEFADSPAEITARALQVVQGGTTRDVAVAGDDLVLVTNGSMVADLARGSMREAAPLITDKRDGSWELWETLARKRREFGRPWPFTDKLRDSAWPSFTVTCREREFFDRIEQLSGSEAGQGGLMTFRDSNWLITIALFHQPHFIGQPDDVYVWWGYALMPYRPGNHVAKPMTECNGEDILREILGHLHFADAADRIVAASICIPTMMPYAGSVLLPRARGDRPDVVPPGSTNFGFIGQFAEVPDDVVFTTEYSVRSARTAVATLLKLDEAPPPVFKGYLDPGVLYEAVKALYT